MNQENCGCIPSPLAFVHAFLPKRKTVNWQIQCLYLLHDVGKIILDPYVLERKDAFDDFMKDETKMVLDAEKSILGFDHAEIASDICRKWISLKT